MKRITVYADFDFLSTPQEIGILGTNTFVVKTILSMSILASG
jgi:hypothetical protein